MLLSSVLQYTGRFQVKSHSPCPKSPINLRQIRELITPNLCSHKLTYIDEANVFHCWKEPRKSDTQSIALSVYMYL